MATAVKAPAVRVNLPGGVQAGDDSHVDFLPVLLETIYPVERRAEWLRRNCPRTAALLAAGVDSPALSDLGE